jgi:hypothetical protein
MNRVLYYDYRHLTIDIKMHKPQEVSKSEFKAKALEFFRAIEVSGENLIVTNHGKPTIEVRIFRPINADPLLILQGSVLRFEDPMDSVGTNDWEALA